VNPQQLNVVDVFQIKGGDWNDPDWVAYDRVLRNEACSAKSCDFYHGRPCALSFNDDGAAYKSITGSPELTGPEMAWVAYWAHKKVPARKFQHK
jgi:hypothetical protein